MSSRFRETSLEAIREIGRPLTDHCGFASGCTWGLIRDIPDAGQQGREGPVGRILADCDAPSISLGSTRRSVCPSVVCWCALRARSARAWGAVQCLSLGGTYLAGCPPSPFGMGCFSRRRPTWCLSPLQRKCQKLVKWCGIRWQFIRRARIVSR